MSRTNHWLLIVFPATAVTVSDIGEELVKSALARVIVETDRGSLLPLTNSSGNPLYHSSQGSAFWISGEQSSNGTTQPTLEEELATIKTQAIENEVPRGQFSLVSPINNARFYEGDTIEVELLASVSIARKCAIRN